MASTGKRRLRRWIGGIAVLGLGLWWIGSTSTITPPTDPADPQPVFVLRDGLHRLLALPDERGVLSVWSYGDWDWYANNHDAWTDVFDTVLWPTTATLARRDVPGTSETSLRAAYRYAAIDEIAVSRADVTALRARLEALWAGGGPPHYNARYRTHFVRDRTGYWFAHNCNDALAGWLRELRCGVSWVPLRTDLRLPE